MVCFDAAHGFRLASAELLRLWRPMDAVTSTGLEVESDLAPVLQLLEPDLRTMVQAIPSYASKISDIVLDKGRPPCVWAGGERFWCSSPHRLVSQEEIQAVVQAVGGEGGFGCDNRAGFEAQLHRISAMRGRAQSRGGGGAILGLTLRMGRFVRGNADLIRDVIDGMPDKSILILGEPGSGKTTIVRDAARMLAERHNVCVVDTSNEIGGDGDVPHPCIGHSRRMMVPSLQEQGRIMVEALQNHTPHVMVIDEIGRPPEVEAARTVKQRGVRLLASAHGNLRTLIKNKQLNGLLGGVSSVMVGDAAAAAASQGGRMSKLRAERGGAPTFDVVVEVSREQHHEWRLVLDVAGAVDAILEGQRYKFQCRSRDTGGTSFRVELGSR